MKKQIAIGIIAAMTFGLSANAFADAQTKAQQKCINSNNKGMAKVAGAENKAVAKCVKTAAKDGTTNYQSCSSANPKPGLAATKNCSKETKVCTEAPDFGHTSCGNVNFNSIQQADIFADDIFGVPAGVTSCSSDKDGCKCQGKAYKASLKVYKSRMKDYNKCKKLGLKDKAAAFDDVVDLNGCVGSDLKGKVAKAETKLDGAITKKCSANVANPFPNVFSECQNLNGANLGTCMKERVRCHVCLTEVASDNLTRDCDQFDDGNNENNSCDFPDDVPE